MELSKVEGADFVEGKELIDHKEVEGRRAIVKMEGKYFR